MRKIICTAAVISVACVIAIFAGSGEDMKKDSPRPQIEVSPSDVPTGINYQGILTDSRGDPVEDREYSIRFRLYNDPGPEAVMFWESTQNIQTYGGLFNVLLPIPQDRFDGSDRWLGLKVGEDDEMVPRQQIVSVPYAYMSGDNTGGNCWELTGNAATTSGIHFLGTIDDQALELSVNGERALRIEPYDYCPNIIGGYNGNQVRSLFQGNTIGGGGRSDNINYIEDNFSTIGGGEGNTVLEDHATIGGGWDNTASGLGSTIGGGWDNVVSEFAATVSGGWTNIASGAYATIPGGRDNSAQGFLSFAAGFRAKARATGCFV
jgi:hypothetical protein